MIILSHSGKQHSYQVALALERLNELSAFYTSSYISSEALQGYFDRQGDTFWSRRYIRGLPAERVHASWRFEIPELLLRKIQGKSMAVQRAVYRRDVAFDRYVAARIKNSWRKKKEDMAFWGFQGSSFSSLEAANQRGWNSICELATAHVSASKKILGEEARLHPEWAGSLDNLVFPAAYERRLEEEPFRAQRVIAASSFTRQTLLDAGLDGNKISLLPLGADLSHISYREKLNTELSSRPLKLLYAGTVTQRKGIKYLLEAMKQLNAKNDIELHIIGGIQGGDAALRLYDGYYKWHGPVSQKDLFQRYTDFDALVLPTVFEGFGLVIVEAMAAGLPVITTTHSIGPEVIMEGESGYIVPLRDSQALARAIMQLRGLSDEAFTQMSRKARAAALAFSWEAYESRLKTLLPLL